MYTLADKSRGNGKYKKSENEVVTDTGMTGLTNCVYPSLRAKAIKMVVENVDEYDEMLVTGMQEVVRTDQDNSEFRKEYSRLV